LFDEPTKNDLIDEHKKKNTLKTTQKQRKDKFGFERKIVKFN